MTTLAMVSVASYLIGGIPFSYIAGRLIGGVDLRRHGSGNLGATNTYRLLGVRVAVAVLLLDVAKGFVPVLLAGRIDASIDVHWLRIAAMFFAILGHLFSPYLGFAGGKGIATSAGAFAALAPWAFVGSAVVFAIVMAARRIVSLASLCAAALLPLFVFVAGRMGFGDSHWSLLVVAGAIMLIVVLKHRSNIKRLRAGTEKRLARVRTP